MAQGIAVYVQALPSSVGEAPSKNFGDNFEDSEFELSHSSKVALSIAKGFGSHEITAMGHEPVLHEAIARGATSTVSLPFCDNPYEQAKSIPRDLFSKIIIPESVDGPFTGASLAGALISLYGYSFQLVEKEGFSRHAAENSVLLVKDYSSSIAPIDLRRIKLAVEVKIEKHTTVGLLNVSRINPKDMHEELRGEPRDISNAITKRLKRVTLQI
ncbi:MAG: hypothetical protein ACYC7D_00350 [Nitrososphaerales archaeon]